MLASSQGQRGDCTTRTAVGECRTICELDADRVETLGTAEGDGGGCGGCWEGWQAGEPGAVRTSPERTLAEGGRDRPGEASEDWVVV